MEREAIEHPVRELSFEVLKPRKPGLIDLTNKLFSLPGVEGVRIDLKETDKNTETIEIRLDGKINYDLIKNTIEEGGGIIHTLNTVVAGKLFGE